MPQVMFPGSDPLLPWSTGCWLSTGEAAVCAHHLMGCRSRRSACSWVRHCSSDLLSPYWFISWETRAEVEGIGFQLLLSSLTSNYSCWWDGRIRRENLEVLIIPNLSKNLTFKLEDTQRFSLGTVSEVVYNSFSCSVWMKYFVSHEMYSQFQRTAEREADCT